MGGKTTGCSMSILKILITVSTLFFLVGCAAPKHHDAIFFVTNTQVGVKVGADAYQRPTIELGYNRQEGAVVPLYIANTDKYMSDQDPFVRGVLKKISENLNMESDEGDKNAGELMKNASIMYNSDSKSKPSPVLIRIEKEMALMLSVSDVAARKGQRLLLKNLIQVELEKPQLIAQFNEAAKYVARQNGNDRTDAYSVFGTFSGDTGASSDSQFSTGTVDSESQSSGDGSTPKGTANASFKGGVAQSFATGVAAQIWAAQGAGIAGGTPNEIKISTDFKKNFDTGYKDVKEKNEAIEKITAYIFPDDKKNENREKEYRELLSDKVKDPALLDKIFKNKDNLKKYLAGTSLTIEDIKNHHIKLLGIEEKKKKEEGINKIVDTIFPGGTKDAAKETQYRNILDPQKQKVAQFDTVFISKENLQKYLLNSSFTADDLNGHLKKLNP